LSLFKDCSKEWMQYCTLKQKNLQWRAISSFFIFQFYLNFFDEWHGKSIYSPATITNMAICLNCSSRERMFSDNKIINEMDSPVGLRSGAFVLILMFNFSSHIFVSKKSLWKTSRITCSSHSSFLISSVCLSVCLSAFLFLSLQLSNVLARIVNPIDLSIDRVVLVFLVTETDWTTTTTTLLFLFSTHTHALSHSN